MMGLCCAVCHLKAVCTAAVLFTRISTNGRINDNEKKGHVEDEGLIWKGEMVVGEGGGGETAKEGADSGGESVDEELCIEVQDECTVGTCGSQFFPDPPRPRGVEGKWSTGEGSKPCNIASSSRCRSAAQVKPRPASLLLHERVASTILEKGRGGGSQGGRGSYEERANNAITWIRGNHIVAPFPSPTSTLQHHQLSYLPPPPSPAPHISVSPSSDSPDRLHASPGVTVG